MSITEKISELNQTMIILNTLVKNQGIAITLNRVSIENSANNIDVGVKKILVFDDLFKILNRTKIKAKIIISCGSIGALSGCLFGPIGAITGLTVGIGTGFAINKYAGV